MPRTCGEMRGPGDLPGPSSVLSMPRRLLVEPHVAVRAERLLVAVEARLRAILLHQRRVLLQPRDLRARALVVAAVAERRVVAVQALQPSCTCPSSDRSRAVPPLSLVGFSPCGGPNPSGAASRGGGSPCRTSSSAASADRPCGTACTGSGPSCTAGCGSRSSRWGSARTCFALCDAGTTFSLLVARHAEVCAGGTSRGSVVVPFFATDGPWTEIHGLRERGTDVVAVAADLLERVAALARRRILPTRLGVELLELGGVRHLVACGSSCRTPRSGRPCRGRSRTTRSTPELPARAWPTASAASLPYTVTVGVTGRASSRCLCDAGTTFLPVWQSEQNFLVWHVSVHDLMPDFATAARVLLDPRRRSSCTPSRPACRGGTRCRTASSSGW